MFETTNLFIDSKNRRGTLRLRKGTVAQLAKPGESKVPLVITTRTKKGMAFLLITRGDQLKLNDILEVRI